ncbi:hypothetical protein P7H17_16085 [Paenibacillus larvae]|nr:hypothetical protein [Paenibacillus larvae]MDT2287239.1 hypothetical protein [Paenibacillus larvae]
MLKTGSRCNPKEAQAIVEWIKANQNRLLAYYNEPRILKGEKPLTVRELFGIVTPFTAQKNELKRWLNNAGLGNNRWNCTCATGSRTANRDLFSRL